MFEIPLLFQYSKGWMRVLARLRTISLQVSISGARLKMFYSRNLSLKKHPGNATRDGWKIRKSCVLTGWLSFADELKSTDFQNALNHFSFEKKSEKKREFLRWVHTIETGT